MPISQFKARCLRVIEDLDPAGLDITKHGKVIATVLPAEQQSSALIGCMAGEIEVRGDIFSTGAKWNAES